MAPKVHGAWNLHLRVARSRPRLLRAVLLGELDRRRSGAGQLRRGQRLSRRARPPPSQARPARAGGQLGPALRSRLRGAAREGGGAPHRQGILGISPAEALGLLGRLLRSRAAQIGVVRVDWQRWASFLPAVASAPRYAALVGASVGADGGEAGRGVRDTVLEAPADERLGVVTAYVREQVGRVLRTSGDEARRRSAALGARRRFADGLRARESHRDAVRPRAADEQAHDRSHRRAAGGGVARGVDGGVGGRSRPVRFRDGRRVASAAWRISSSPFAPRGNRAPLFCVHPAGGLANIYQHLAESLPADLPVQGLQSREIAQGVADADLDRPARRGLRDRDRRATAERSLSVTRIFARWDPGARRHRGARSAGRARRAARRRRLGSLAHPAGPPFGRIS